MCGAVPAAAAAAAAVASRARDSEAGCFRTSRELPRHVGRLASPDRNLSLTARSRRSGGPATVPAVGGAG
jgi:hypothetical protein